MAKRNIKNKALWKKRISQALKGKKRNKRRLTKDSTRAAIRYREDYRGLALAAGAVSGGLGLAGLGYGLSKPGFRQRVGKPLGAVTEAVGATRGFLGAYLKKGEISGAALAASQEIENTSSVLNKAKENFRKELNQKPSIKDQNDIAYVIGSSTAKTIKKSKSWLNSLKENTQKRIEADSAKRKRLLGFSQTEEVIEKRNQLFSRIQEGKTQSNLEFARKRKPVSAATRKKISQGVTAHYDRVGRKPVTQEKFIEGRKNLRAAASAFATVAGGVATLMSAGDKRRLVHQQLTQGNARAWLDTGTRSFTGLSRSGSSIAGIFSNSGKARRDLMKIDLEYKKLPLKRSSTASYERMSHGFHRKLDLEAERLKLRKKDRR